MKKDTAKDLDQIARLEEVKKLIAAWAAEKNILRPGQVIEVQLRITTPETVQVKIEGYQDPKDVDRLNVSDLRGLSVRATNCLYAVGLETVGQIRKKSLRDLLGKRNFGGKTARELSDFFRDKLGIKLGWYPETE